MSDNNELHLQDFSTFGVAAFALLHQTLRTLVESGAVPEAVIFSAIKKTVANLEGPIDSGWASFDHEAAAALLRKAFPTAMSS